MTESRRRGVWQRRFWEHTIKDQRDYEKHLNYIHFNPIKHRLAPCAHAWKWTSFHRLVNQRIYEPAWCCACEGRKIAPPDFGDMDDRSIEAAYGE